MYDECKLSKSHTKTTNVIVGKTIKSKRRSILHQNKYNLSLFRSQPLKIVLFKIRNLHFFLLIFDMTKTKEDSLIFSVTYQNYLNRVLIDKENKTLGAWQIKKDLKTIKYAYVYLKGSKQMIVKKYEIEKFESCKKSKGYPNAKKKCFVFKRSKDIFFEYPYAQVQSRQYASSKELDSLPRLNEDEVKERFKKSDPKNESYRIVNELLYYRRRF